MAKRRRVGMGGDFIGRVLRERIDAKNAEENRVLCHGVLCAISAAVSAGEMGVRADTFLFLMDNRGDNWTPDEAEAAERLRDSLMDLALRSSRPA